MIKKLIAHQLVKDAHSNVSTLVKRDDVLPIDSELSNSLFEQLQQSFRNHSPIVGKFRSTGDTSPAYQQVLIEYLAETTNGDEHFISMSSRGMDLLKVEIEKQSLATGGYIIFCEYETNGNTYLLVSLLSTKAQPTFDEHLNLVAAITPNLTDLRHAARIKLGSVSSNSEGVVQFISRRTSGVSDYFRDFLGCEEITRPDVQAGILYTVLTNWAKEQNYSEEQRSNMMTQAYSHWQKCRKEKRPMTLAALANVLVPSEPSELLTHLTKEGQNLAGEFPAPSPSSMKRFVRFSYDGRSIKLEFDRNVWGNQIQISESERTLTIRDAPEELLEMLRAEDEQ